MSTAKSRRALLISEMKRRSCLTPAFLMRWRGVAVYFYWVQVQWKNHLTVVFKLHWNLKQDSCMPSLSTPGQKSQSQLLWPLVLWALGPKGCEDFAIEVALNKTIIGAALNNDKVIIESRAEQKSDHSVKVAGQLAKHLANPMGWTALLPPPADSWSALTPTSITALTSLKLQQLSWVCNHTSWLLHGTYYDEDHGAPLTSLTRWGST